MINQSINSPIVFHKLLDELSILFLINKVNFFNENVGFISGAVPIKQIFKSDILPEDGGYEYLIIDKKKNTLYSSSLDTKNYQSIQDDSYFRYSKNYDFGTVIITLPIVKYNNSLVDTLRSNTLYILLLYILTVIFIYFISKRITNPLSKLVEQLDKEVEIKIESNYTEINTLVATINQQRENLLDLNTNLEYKVNEQSKKLNIYFDSMKDGLAIANVRTKKFIDCNKAFEKLTGYKKDELLCMTIDQIHPKKDLPYVIDMFTRQANKEIVIAPKIPILHKDKTAITMCDISTDNYVSENRDILNIGIFRDITNTIMMENELKDINQNLEQRIKDEVEKNIKKETLLFEQAKDASMGQMIGNIAHQWRQPLNAISLTTNNLRFKCMMDDMDNEIFEKELTLIDEYSQHLSKTIDTFRNFLREKKELKEFILQNRVDASLNIVGVALKDENITLKNNISSSAPLKITSIATELSEVIINIINNSKDILMEKTYKMLGLN